MKYLSLCLFLMGSILMGGELVAETPYEIVLEDFDDGNLWSPVSSLGWWHLDDDSVYVYNISEEHAFKGKYAMRLDYKKAAPYQLVAGYFDSVNPRKNFSNYDVLSMHVYGAVKVLLKLEDRRGGQTNVGIKTALHTDQWNQLEFDFSQTTLDKDNIKNIFLFIAPNDAHAEGTVYIDQISLIKSVNSQNLVDQFLGKDTEVNDSGLGENNASQMDVKKDFITIVSAVDLDKDSEGRIYVLQSMGGFVFQYDTNGRYLNEFARRGQGVGELDRPTSISFAPDEDKLYVADYENKRVQKFLIDGSVDDTFGKEGVLNWRGDGEPFGILKDLAVDTQGMLYVLDTSDNSVWKYASDGLSGQLLWKNAEQSNFFMEPVKLTVFKDRLFVVDQAAASIDCFSLDGEYVASYKCVDEKGKYFVPSDCAFDPLTETCLVISNEKLGIFVFDKDWKYLGMSHPDMIQRPQFIRVLERNGEVEVFIGDKGQNRVQILDMETLKNAIL